MSDQTWAFQLKLDLLVSSGFAEIDTEATDWHARAEYGSKKPMYRWTDIGRVTCFRYRYTTPMAWAHAIYESKERHCEGCGRDLFGKPTGAHWGKRCLCKGCHANGKQLLLQS